MRFGRRQKRQRMLGSCPIQHVCNWKRSICAAVRITSGIEPIFSAPGGAICAGCWPLHVGTIPRDERCLFACDGLVRAGDAEPQGISPLLYITRGRCRSPRRAYAPIQPAASPEEEAKLLNLFHSLSTTKFMPVRSHSLSNHAYWPAYSKGMVKVSKTLAPTRKKISCILMVFIHWWTKLGNGIMFLSLKKNI